MIKQIGEILSVKIVSPISLWQIIITAGLDMHTHYSDMTWHFGLSCYIMKEIPESTSEFYRIA